MVRDARRRAAALAPETNSSCLRRRRLDGASIRLDQMRHRQLGTSHGCRDHTVLPYVTASVILRAVPAHGRPPCEHRLAPDAACVHRIPSRVRDDARSAPLAGPGRAEIATDLGVRESEIFFRGTLDDPNQPAIVQQIAVRAPILGAFRGRGVPGRQGRTER